MSLSKELFSKTFSYIQKSVFQKNASSKNTCFQKRFSKEDVYKKIK